MVPFRLEAPRAIHFGIGALHKLPALVGGPGKRVLLVAGTDGFPARLASAHQRSPDRLCLRKSLHPRGGARIGSIPHRPRLPPRPLPLTSSLPWGEGRCSTAPRHCRFSCDSPGSAGRFLEGVPGPCPFPAGGVPWIAVPTTAGTGAEVTYNAVVRSEELGVKRSMRSLSLASAVIVDPRLTLSLPADVTGTSGLDALTQLVESYVSRSTNPYVQSIVEGAIGPMIGALRGLQEISPTRSCARRQATARS